MPQGVLEHPLLDRDLCARIQVLHRAAATCATLQSEVRTARLHALTACLQDLHRAADVEFLAAPDDLPADPFAGQRALHERDLAFSAHDAAALLVERLDPIDPQRFHWRGAAGHAFRNSCQTGPPDAANASRTTCSSAAYSGSS